MQDLREDARRPTGGKYFLTWRGHDGKACSAEGRGLDVSPAGVGVECLREFQSGSLVYVLSADGFVGADCVVVHCTRKGLRFHVGFEFRDEPRNHAGDQSASQTEAQPSYYDILQISPKADMETIHRVFRIMAARFHPDNPETGDVEEFLRLRQAYAVLSDPPRRVEYDSLRETLDSGPMPIFELKDFVTGVEAESNRRLGVLSILYNQRRMDPDHPGVSLLDLEKMMGFPREYLSFTMWYLRSKEFAFAADNSDYALSAAGADFVENNTANNEILTRLIKPGPARVHGDPGGPNPKTPATPRRALKFLMEATGAKKPV